MDGEVKTTGKGVIALPAFFFAPGCYIVDDQGTTCENLPSDFNVVKPIIPRVGHLPTTHVRDETTSHTVPTVSPHLIKVPPFIA